MMHYKPAWGFSHLAAVFIWAGMQVLNISMALLIGLFFRDSILDWLIVLFTGSISGYNLFYFFKVFFDFRGKQARQDYFNASVIGAMTPGLLWPFFLILYFFHTLIYVSYYPSASYATFKLFLSFLWNVISGFFIFECLFPMYEWW